MTTFMIGLFSICAEWNPLTYTCRTVLDVKMFIHGLVPTSIELNVS